MSFCVSVRLKKLVTVGLLYSIALLSVVPFAPLRSASGAEQSSQHSANQSSPAAHRPGEVLVRFRPNASDNDKDTAAASQGARRKKKLRGASAVETLELTTAGDVVSAALRLNLNPAVEFAEPNFIVKSDQLGTDDPRLNEQWALNNTGQNGGNYGSDIKATDAWQTTQGSTNTVIAVIDSGIDFNHPDLVNNQWTNPLPTMGDVHGWDFVANAGTIKDEQGHGTAMAGIIAAQGNNGIGTSGVMWRAGLMSLRVLDNTGAGDVADAVEAIDYAIAHGAHVINLSWGTEGPSIALKDAIDRALRRGIAVVCSAGNSGRNLDDPSSAYYPASFESPGLIAVAGNDNRDQLLSWSNFGATHVAVAAPGENILTTQMGGGYWNVTGTSAAAPLVTGTAGLIKTLRPSLAPRQLKKAITDAARQTASFAGKVQSGGVIDAAKSIAALPGGDNANRGNGNQMRVSPGPRYGSGGTGPGGSFNTTPPPVTTGAPSSTLPNLDQLRNSNPAPPTARTPIQSNQMCADCDPQGGGGGGGYYPSGDPNFSTARRRPVNETGQPGVDLGSRNFNWSQPLLSLPGRAGMDLNLTLSYNSLVWTKDGSYIKYNSDLGSPAPGFSLGLPKLQQRFLNSTTGIYAYIMVTPSGGRIELRQVGTSNTYESEDGSYTQLDSSIPSALLVRTSDGMQFTFAPVTINSEYRCVQIKDRNGNFVSASYDTNNGHLQTITDTLGRVITFVYDGNNNLIAIRQTWAGVAHDWATFSYGQAWVAPNFGGGLTVNGPNSNYVTVLTQVSLHDGSYITFNYNSAFGQVNRINHYAADGRLRDYTAYNVDRSAGQTDCPRFTERRDWAEMWNNSNEAVTSFSVSADGSWSQQTAPEGTIYKEFFATTGWQNGLTTTSEIWSGGLKKKWTTISLTQDDTNLSYQKNPRVTETNVYDAEGNRKRSTINYTTFTLPSGASCSLPADAYEYAADAVTILRRTHTDYRYDSAYIDRRIIGLASLTWVHDGSGALIAKTWHDYDWPAASAHLVSTAQPSVQHDAAYDVNFATGRGNLVLVLRFDLTDPENAAGRASEFKYGYNTDGSMVFARDHLWHQTNISYQDSFSDGGNTRNTFAYPTTVTDPDGFASTAQYNFDFGAVTRTQTPAPAGQAQGLIKTFAYDAAVRLERVTVANTGAYTRFVHGPYYVQSFSSVNNVADDAYSCQILDGAGRVTQESSNHPGSTGGYIGQLTTYDVMGRAIQKTKPTEITGGWAPTGDDAAGWVWTNQAYDWQSRPTIATLPDGSTTENTYGGCGCAGGEVVTSRDERGRRRRATMDVLGRLKQVEELNWDTSVYSTTSYTYNARDQITQTNQAGQIRTLEYDGFGRLWRRTTPEQGASTYSYNTDDTVQTITDARGATTTFAYNNRHLPTSITYGVPGDVAATPNVSFVYDGAGNRTSMSDGLGSVSYAHDQLSRLTSETRTFTGVGSFALSYSYNLASELTGITNPWNAQVGYNYDSTGRPTEVTGANYAGVSSYATSLAYRAFGLKGMNYGNGRALSLKYDNRLRLTESDVPGVMGWNHGYNYFGDNTGRVTYAQNKYDATLDRSYHYDHVGRWQSGFTGSAARAHVGTGSSWLSDGPYAAQNNVYDVWGNMTDQEGWGGTLRTETASYTNNRRNGLQYDAAGNLIDNGGMAAGFDATGQQVTANYIGYSLTQQYDGDGLRAKKTENGATTYYLRSTVLGGQIVAEMNSTGTWTRGFVYQGSSLLAVQQSNAVFWMHEDPITKSKRVTDSSGAVVSTIELDPWGGETTRSSNSAFQPKNFTSYTRDGNHADEAMFRRYNRWWSRFDQPDPYDGSYNLTDPQSFNRYAYVQNDPVNFVDPTGLLMGEINIGDVGVVTVYDGGPDPFDDPFFTGYNNTVPMRPFGGGGDIGGGGGGGGGGLAGSLNPQNSQPTTPAKEPGYVNQYVLSECLRALFGVKTTSFAPSAPGRSGTFTGTGILFTTGQRGHIGVLNNVTATNTQDLRNLSDSVRRQAGEEPLPSGSVVLGYTPGWNPHMNYSARNQSAQSLVVTQVHELGHSLQIILKGPFVGNMADQLENCVRDNGGFTRK